MKAERARLTCSSSRMRHRPQRATIMTRSSTARRLIETLAFATLLCTVASAYQQHQQSPAHDENSVHEREYRKLYDTTPEKDALEAIRDLHRQLDDDNDGTIEPSETGDFIRADLHYGTDQRRQTSFHNKDAEITVKDLWGTWRKSEVYNWTVSQTVDWLKNGVELPQYAEHFKRSEVNGTQLPRIAVSASYLSKVIGITNPIHRSKITLKAMDIVLFGPPRDNSNFVKDMILTSLLVVALTGLFYAYHKNKQSQSHLKKMMSDLDSLAKAEETLLDLQEKLQQKDSKIESLSSTPSDVPDAIEVSRMKEELEALRNELQRAEIELEDKCWVAPPVLQHWLQLTYELESVTYNAKKKAAEEQLEMAKDMCDKLKKKRSSLVGAFVSTHGKTIDDVDRSILEAKTALVDLTKDLTERSQRWRQVEMLCGCSITNNPGIAVLQNLVRHVGNGRGALHSRLGLGSRLSSSVSQDDLANDDMDTHSVAASSHMTSASHLSRPSTLLSTTLASQHKKRGSNNERKPPISRDSSKDEASSSDEHVSDNNFTPGTSARSSMNASIGSSSQHLNQSLQNHLTRASTPPVAKTSSPAAVKRSRMVKSFSQDAGGSIQTAVASAGAAVVDGGDMTNKTLTSTISNAMTASVSDSQLQRQHLPEITTTGAHKTRVAAGLSGTSLTSSHSAGSAGLRDSNSSLLSRPSIVEELDESCSASDSGSVTDLDGKKKKKRSFFNFRRKKERKEIL